MRTRTLALKRSTILSAALVAIVIAWTATQGVHAMELAPVAITLNG